MKTKLARKLAARIERGEPLPQHVMYAVAQQLGRPLAWKTQTSTAVYFPRGLKGDFSSCWNSATRRSTTKPTATLTDDDICRSKLPLKSGGGCRVTLEPSCGSDIRWVGREAALIAKAVGVRVGFGFNDTPLVVAPTDTLGHAHAEYVRIGEERAAAYRNSPEGKAEARRERRQRRERRAHGRLLVQMLPDAVQDEGALMSWIKQMARHGGWTCQDIDYRALAKTIEQAGYVRSEYVVDEAMSEEERAVIRELLKTDKTALARYVVGQAIECMASGMPPMEVAEMFVDAYNGKMPKRRSADLLAGVTRTRVVDLEEAPEEA